MRLVSIAAVSVAALLAVGCGDSTAQELAERVAERAIEQVEGGDVDIDFDEYDESVKVESSDGTFEQTFGDSLPDSFPADVPVAGDYEIVHATSTLSDQGDGWTVTMTTSTRAADVAEGIKSDFLGDGYQLTNESTTTSDGNTNITYSFEGDGYSAIVGINEDADSGETVVSYIVNEDTSGDEG